MEIPDVIRSILLMINHLCWNDEVVLRFFVRGSSFDFRLLVSGYSQAGTHVVHLHVKGKGNALASPGAANFK